MTAYYQTHKEQQREYRRKWKKAHPKENCENVRKSQFKRYGLTLDAHAGLLSKQNYKCALCDQKFDSTKNTHVDHCHKTNKVRGLLCVRCNLGLGVFKDNPDILRKAAVYVEAAI